MILSFSFIWNKENPTCLHLTAIWQCWMAQDQSLQGAKSMPPPLPPLSETIRKVLTAEAECVENTHCQRSVCPTTNISVLYLPQEAANRTRKQTSNVSTCKTTVCDCDHSYLNTAHQYYLVHRAPVQEFCQGPVVILYVLKVQWSTGQNEGDSHRYACVTNQWSDMDWLRYMYLPANQLSLLPIFWHFLSAVRKIHAPY